MHDTNQPTPLARALAAAAEFGRAHGVENLGPLDFGIQRSEPGLTTANYVDATHVVSVTIDRRGVFTIAAGVIDWIHNTAGPEPAADEQQDTGAADADRGRIGGRPAATVHMGRGWSGTRIEDECPCPQAPCGLVNSSDTDPACEHHPMSRNKSMRQGHRSDECPGRLDAPAAPERDPGEQQDTAAADVDEDDGADVAAAREAGR